MYLMDTTTHSSCNTTLFTGDQSKIGRIRRSKIYNQQLNIGAMRYLLDHFRYLVISSFFKPNQVQWKMYVGRPGLVDPAQLENAFLVFSTSMRIQLYHYHGEANTTKQKSPTPTFNWSPSSQLVTHTHTQSHLLQSQSIGPHHSSWWVWLKMVVLEGNYQNH